MFKHKESLIKSILRPFEQFARTESSSGIILLAMTIVALLIANSGFSDGYARLLESPVTLGTGSASITRSVAHWISDGLMTIFFFLVGLEIKREFISGELSNLKQAALPVFGALGGMIVPASIFALFNHGTTNSSGWGIPMATDIAFALGLVTLLGKRVPVALKIFLIALAIIDDIGAVIVIAVFYTRDIHLAALLAGLGLIGVLIGGNALGIRSRLFYALVGIIVWYLFLESGVHATVAGVLVALTVPAADRKDPNAPSPLSRFEHSLHGFVAYCVVPLFILANAGVRLEGDLLSVFSGDLGLGIIIGLVIGKPLGIFLFAYLASKASLAKLPEQARWSQLLSISFLGGIGFTMSLFIIGLAFRNPEQIADAKLSILLASVVASILGWIACSRLGTRNTPSEP